MNQRFKKLVRPHLNALSVFFLGIVGVRLLFIKTYPLNNSGGDTPCYFDLITHFKSNLCLAPGYLFLAGLPFSIPSLGAFLRSHPRGLDLAFLLAQHGFELLCLAALMIVLSRVFNRLTAAIAVAVAGLSLDGMAVTSSIYPEWLEADLLILALVSVCLGWRSRSFVRKSVWYTLSFATFTWAYFVKFNAFIFFPLLLLPIVLERISLPKRVQLLAMALVFAFINYALFVTLYHQPKTGARSLSYDHSWILMGSLGKAYGYKQLAYPEGIATKRWLALSAAVPPSYNLASAQPWFENVTVGDELRGHYRDIATQLLVADEPELDRFIATHPLPERFDVGVSSVPISLYVGLKESDNLGTKVFCETIFHRPRPFINQVANESARRLLHREQYPLIPLPEDITPYQQTITPIDTTHFRLMFEPKPDYRYGYDSPTKQDPLIWAPGYKFFAAIYRITLPNIAFLAILGFGCIGSVLLMYREGAALPAVSLIALTVNLLAFVVCSTMMAGFRWKEMRLALPVVAILLGVTCGFMVPEVFRTVRSMAARRKSRT